VDCIARPLTPAISGSSAASLGYANARKRTNEMKADGGEYRITVGQLRKLLDGEPDDAVVVVQGTDASGAPCTNSIYKVACAADERFLFLYSGGRWPTRDA
jgi:hypothetical protein